MDRRWWLRASLALVLVATASGSARADDRAAAAEAYDRGSKAFDAGRFREAAEQFRAADRLAPSTAALSSALESASRADDPGLVLELVEIAEARRGDAGLDTTAAAARQRFEPRAGKLLPRCAPLGAPPPPCSIRIRGEARAVGIARWIAAGDHVAVVDRGAGEERFPVVVNARATVEWAPPSAAPPPAAPPPAGAPSLAPTASSAPPPPPEAPPPGSPPGEPARDAGVSPAWFFVGLGATTVLGGAAIGTGVATLSRHDDFETAPSEDGRSEGLLLQNVTNGLLAGAAVAGVATVVLAFVVDWSGEAGGEGQRAGALPRSPVLARF